MTLKEYYDGISPGYDNLYKEEQESKWDVIGGYIQAKGKSVLEVGAGTGIITEKLQRANRLVAVDLSERMISIAKAKGIKAEFMIADAENLPFENKEFDFVISVTVLQDLKNPLKAIEEMRRVGKKVIFSLLAKGRKAETVRKRFGGGTVAGKDEFWILE
jgi:ubiquinone/menaquinone biosynthesis C-methylase UbiE